MKSIERWCSGGSEFSFDIEAGEYAAQVLEQDSDYPSYRQHLVEVLGEGNVRYSERIDKCGTLAWIPTLIFFLSLLSSFGRANWMWGMLIVVAAWIPYALLSRLPRYRRIQAAREDNNRKIPTLLLELRLLSQNQTLPGGCFNVW